MSHHGSEESTSTKQGFRIHIEVEAVDWWRAVRGEEGLGNWGNKISLNQEDGENVCPKFLQTLLESFDRRSCNDGSWQLIPIFHNPHQKADPLLRRRFVP